MITAQHRHLRTAPRAGRLDRLAGFVEHAHVRERSARAAMRALNVRALRPDAREVVADASAAPHRLRRLVERSVDADLAIIAGDRITDRRHEAVDQCRLELGFFLNDTATTEN